MPFKSRQQQAAVLILLHKTYGRERVGRMKVAAFGRGTVDPDMLHETLADYEENLGKPLSRSAVRKWKNDIRDIGRDVYDDMVSPLYSDFNGKYAQETRRQAREFLIQRYLDTPGLLGRTVKHRQRLQNRKR